MAQRTGTQLFAKATIADDTIAVQVADQAEINDGWHSFDTLAAMQALPLQYRHWGMIGNVENDSTSGNNKPWVLKRPTSRTADNDGTALMNNSNWVEFTAGSTITIDATPTTNSTNAVQSGGTKAYIDGKVPVSCIVQGNVASPYLLTYSLSNGYMNRYKNANPVINTYSALRVGDLIYNTDASGNLIGIYKVTQVPTFNNWDPISGGANDPQGSISIPSHIFDTASIDSNGLPVLDSSWNSTGTIWQLGYVRVNGMSGLSFSTTSGFTTTFHPTGPCTVYGGYIYKDPDGTWHPATQYYGYIIGIGAGSTGSPYISAPSGLPYYGSGILVDSTNFAAYEANNSGENPGTVIGTSLIGSFGQVLELSENPVAASMPVNSYIVAKNTTTQVVSIWVNDGGTLKSIAFS